jgi:negative regulator of replication initiation
MTLRALAALALITTTSCSAQAVLTQQEDARRLASELLAQFSKAADASNRAVMTDADEDSTSAVREAEQATQDVLRAVDQLRQVLTSMGYSEEITLLDAFMARFAEYRKVDAEILPLAVENTNAKAQRLSFGPAAEAVNEFRTALNAAVKSAAPDRTSRLELLAARAVAAVLDIQVLRAPHIAEPEDEAMTRMERRMAASEKEARAELAQMRTLLPAASGPQLTAATAALDRFTTIHTEIITLSRRNSDVRSLALSPGRKRMIVAQCDDELRALRATLAKHAVGATR